MIKDKISSQEIIDLVSVKASVSKRAAEEFLKVMIATIEEALLAGEVVKIKNFGTFKLQWNEPRKSVNVQTGEDIIIAGYSKVTFVPDSVLKDTVNEPFAHLSAVDLEHDNENTSQEAIDDVVLDPLRIFNEQAADIKELLADINALSISKKLSKSVENEENNTDNTETNTISSSRLEIADYDLTVLDNEQYEKYGPKTSIDAVESDDNIHTESKLLLADKIEPNQESENIIFEEPSIIESQDLIVEDAELISDSNGFKIKNDNYNNSEVDDYVPNPYIKDLESKVVNVKEIRRKRLIIPIVLLLLFLLLFGLYSLIPPINRFVNNVFYPLNTTTNTIKQNFSTTEMFNTVGKWFAPKPIPKPKPIVVVVPKVNKSVVDSAKIVEPVDSLQILFDSPRVFNKFIGSERIKAGSRLTLMSKKYYGKTDFWVYIYEANIDKIPNPDNIASGTLIRIPKIDARLIDKSNPKCIQKALELHDLYVK